MSSNQFGGPGLALTNLETISKATVQALNNLNQTLTSFNNNAETQLAAIISAIDAFDTALTNLLSGIPGIPVGAKNVSAGATVADTPVTITLPAAADVTTYVTGFDITSSGASAASIVSVEVSDNVSLFLLYAYAVVAGVTSPNAPLSIRFPGAMAASAQNTAIFVTLPALGSGNTNAAVSVYGYQL